MKLVPLTIAVVLLAIMESANIWLRLREYRAPIGSLSSDDRLCGEARGFSLEGDGDKHPLGWSGSAAWVLVRAGDGNRSYVRVGGVRDAGMPIAAGARFYFPTSDTGKYVIRDIYWSAERGDSMIACWK